MIRLAIKNLLTRFGSYIWLFLELSAVAFLSWFVLDELVVLHWSYSRPLGYDADRLIVLKTDVSGDKDNDQETEARTSDLLRMLSRFRSMPEVEYATVVDRNGLPEMIASRHSYHELNDSLGVEYDYVNYVPCQDFFTTMGIKSVDENQTTEYLSDLNPVGEGGWSEFFKYGVKGPANPFIMTESLVNVVYSGDDPYKVNDSVRAQNQYEGRLMAIVQDVRNESTKAGDTWIAFGPICLESVAWRDASIVLRIRPEDSPKEVADRLRKDMTGLKDGGRYVFSVKAYSEIIREKQDGASGRDRRMNVIFAIFFMLNVCVGVMGTFWMMTRKRAREVGVLRSFGSTPAKVRTLLSMEAVILALCGWLVGCGAYFYWARTHGLYIPDDGGYGLHAQTWITNFPQHFAIIATIILALLILSVLLGVLLPAWRLSRIHPVDALRDE